jgi:hypothetical protein
LLFALLATACADEGVTDVTGAKDLKSSAPSFLVANASVVIHFEPGEAGVWYLPGKIEAQDDWSSLGPYDHLVVLNAGAPYSYPSFGLQSLRISNAITSGSFGDQTFSKRTTNYAGETESQCSIWCVPGGTRRSHFEVEQDFASTVPAAEQQGLAVTVSPDRGDGARMSFYRLRDEPAGLAVDFVDVQGVDFSGPLVCGEANFVEATGIATGLNRAVPHTIKLTMDLLEGPSNDIVKVYVDGSLRHTGTSWEDYYRYDCEAATHLGKPPAVNRILYRTSSVPNAPLTALHGFVFDNLSLGTANAAALKDQCKNGGWRSMTRADGTPFKNQGDCIQYTNTGA